MKVLNLINAKKPFLMDQIRALEDHGVQCDTICVPGEFYADDSDFTSRSVWDYARFYPEVLSHVSSDYDVIHAHYGLTAPFALAQPYRPVVLSLWGRDLFGPASWVTKLCAQFCDEVIVRSEEMRTELRMDAHIVERGVDLQTFMPIPQKEAQKEVGWEQTPHHILFPYSPKREKKNYPLAKKVTEELQSKVETKIKLQVVHNEPHNRIPYFMNAADLLLMTSTPKSEGSPNTVKEAMACNRPIVSTDVGDVRELMENVNNCYVASDFSDLVEYSRIILQNDRTSNGRKKMQDLTWSATVDQLLSVYHDAL